MPTDVVGVAIMSVMASFSKSLSHALLKDSEIVYEKHIHPIFITCLQSLVTHFGSLLKPLFEYIELYKDNDTKIMLLQHLQPTMSIVKLYETNELQSI